MRKLLVVSIACLLIMIATPALASAPSNDDFANATLVSTVPSVDSQSVADATRQTGEPNPVCEPVDHTIWYRFVAPSNMQLVVNVTGSDMPVAGGAYTGTTLANLQPLRCMESLPSGTPAETKMWFSVSAGKTYYIQLGNGVEAGSIGTINVSFQRGGSFSGTVSTADHKPLNQACITAIDSQGFYAGNAFAPRSGRYTITGLIAGSYKVSFMDCTDGGPRLYATIWYRQKPDQASATPISLAAGGSLGNINGVLPKGGTIAGILTDESTGAPIAGECVEVWDTSGNSVVFSQTNSDGTYVAGPLQTGTYKIEFPSCQALYFPEWYHNRPDIGSADLVSVVLSHQTGGINEDLLSTSGTGSIEGTITDPSSVGVGGICIEADIPSADPIGGYLTVKGAISDYDPAGHYVISGLAPGTYHVFMTGCGQPYADQWINGKTSFDTADPVPVTDGGTATVNPVVQPA